MGDDIRFDVPGIEWSPSIHSGGVALSLASCMVGQLAELKGTKMIEEKTKEVLCAGEDQDWASLALLI